MMTTPCQHQNLRESYYGYTCADCGEFYCAYGQEPWIDDDYPDDEDDEDEWLYRCGWVRGHGCQLAGTEECDFECPHRRDFERGMRLTQARLAKRARNP